MGKGYKRKTRWRTLNIGAPPGEEDEEDGIRNGYAQGQENGTSSKNVQTGIKTVRTDSAGSATSDYASDYASVVSKSKRSDTGGSSSKPNKIIFDENEYTRITTPRQDVLFKKGYLSHKKTWPSTASMSATPSTTESQSASHSTADGSETTEDQQLLDYKENGAEEYPAMIEPGIQVAYGTFYDHASGYYYEYPVMVVDPGPGMPNGPPINNLLTAVPCGPVPLRPIEWVNPAFVPKLGNEQYCVMDYQTAQLGQYPTLVDENGVPLVAQMDNTNGSEEAFYENGNGSTSWAGSVADDEQTGNNTETLNGTTEISSSNEVEENALPPVNSEVYLETALAQQLHVTHVPVPPTPEQLYVYPGHYMFGPSLINVNGVTIQSGPMVRNTGINEGPTNSGAYSKRRKKKKLSRRKSTLPLAPSNAEDEEQEGEYSSEIDNAGEVGRSAVAKESIEGEKAKIDSSSAGITATTSISRPLNPDCQEFRPVLDMQTFATNNEATNDCETKIIDQTIPGSSSKGGETAENVNLIAEESKITTEKSLVTAPNSRSNDEDEEEGKKVEEREKRNSRTNIEISNLPETALDKTKQQQLVSRSCDKIEAKPVDFAADVIANVTIIAERAALASRSVVEGTPMETEIGLDAASVNFLELVENVEARKGELTREEEETSRKLRSMEATKKEVNTRQNNSTGERRESRDKTCVRDESSEHPLIITEKQQRDPTIVDKRGSRSASPGMINRTTTPINANCQRLPESYESLVIRGTTNVASCSLPSLGTTGIQQGQTNRGRKYSSKTPKFVREATPGPDLDDFIERANGISDVVETRARNDRKIACVNESAVATRISRSNFCDDENDGETIVTGIEAKENKSQRYSLSTTEESGSYGWCRRVNNADLSNDDSGIDSQTRLSSDHPITDAVTEWLQRANSPELFVTRGMITESEPEDDELENDEPPKNLQGNPMPALSANSGDAINTRLSRFASFGKFAIINCTTDETTIKAIKTCEKNDNIDITRITNETTCSISRRKKHGDNFDNGRTTRRNSVVVGSKMAHERERNVGFGENEKIDSARQKLFNNIISSSSSSSSCSEVEKTPKMDEVCEFTEDDSVAGMRVAKSSRTKRNKIAVGSIPTNNNGDSSKSRKIAERAKRTRRKERTNKINVTSDRVAPIENVEIKVRRVATEGEDNDEGIVEDEEIGVKTFEKGRIVVSNVGKVLPVDNYLPILLKNNEDVERNDGPPKFSKITCEKSERWGGRSVDETSASETASKRNSLDGIEEPDVLECWEIETVEPVTTPKRIHARGRSLEGEDNEDDGVARTNVDTIDPAAVEIVRKYYRLEAMGNSVTSIEDVRDTVNNNNVPEERRKMLDNHENMIDSMCSDEINIIDERMNKIVESMLEKSGLQIDEAVEVYESFYGDKDRIMIGNSDAKYGNRILFGQNPEREDAVPCKAACCIIQ